MALQVLGKLPVSLRNVSSIPLRKQLCLLSSCSYKAIKGTNRMRSWMCDSEPLELVTIQEAQRISPLRANPGWKQVVRFPPSRHYSPREVGFSGEGAGFLFISSPTEVKHHWTATASWPTRHRARALHHVPAGHEAADVWMEPPVTDLSCRKLVRFWISVLTPKPSYFRRREINLQKQLCLFFKTKTSFQLEVRRLLF